MADSVADKHTDGNRNHDGSDLVYGVERESREHLTVVPALSGKKIVSNNELLLHVVDYLHEALANLVGRLHGGSLAIDANDGLGIGLAQVYPTVREVDLHAVDVVHCGTVVLGEYLLHLHEDCVDIGLGCEVDAVLGYLVFREGGAKR